MPDAIALEVQVSDAVWDAHAKAWRVDALRLAGAAITAVVTPDGTADRSMYTRDGALLRWNGADRPVSLAIQMTCRPHGGEAPAATPARGPRWTGRLIALALAFTAPALGVGLAVGWRLGGDQPSRPTPAPSADQVDDCRESLATLGAVIERPGAELVDAQAAFRLHKSACGWLDR